MGTPNNLRMNFLLPTRLHQTRIFWVIILLSDDIVGIGILFSILYMNTSILNFLHTIYIPLFVYQYLFALSVFWNILKFVVLMYNVQTYGTNKTTPVCHLLFSGLLEISRFVSILLPFFFFVIFFLYS